MKKRELAIGKIIIGQGVDKTTLDTIYGETWKKSTGQHIEIIENVTQKVPKELVHKHQSANVLITHPKTIRVGDETYFTAYLAIDKNCTEMTEHISRSKIQDNILTEAARQIFIVVTETYVAEKANIMPNNFAYALQKIDIKFYAPVYPLEVFIVLHLPYAMATSRKIEAMAMVTFLQKGQICCEFKFAGMGYLAKLLQKIEEKQAKKCYRRFYDQTNTSGCIMQQMLQSHQWKNRFYIPEAN
jgi:hypothetical protein